jgi:hypothetical protein
MGNSYEQDEMINRSSLEKKLVSIGITSALFLQFALPIGAQQAPAVPPPPPGLPTELAIVVVEGEGAMLDVHQRAGKDPVVRIEDQNHSPINGAVVVFTLPTEGATGEFTGGNKTVTVTTDSQGMAMGKGLKINQVPGKLQVHVTVSYKGLSARTNIVEFVEGPAIHGTQGVKSGGKGKWIAILALIGGAGAGGAFAAMGKKSSTPATPTPGSPTPSAPTPIGITPGTGTIAPPH